eukprot:10837413-Alexandrium_andersonii.AAC.1
MGHWKQSRGEPPIDYNMGEWPTALQIQQIREHLQMPALEDPEFSGILEGEQSDAGRSDEGRRVRPKEELERAGLSSIQVQQLVEDRKGSGGGKGNTPRLPGPEVVRPADPTEVERSIKALPTPPAPSAQQGAADQVPQSPKQGNDAGKGSKSG